MSSDHNSFPPTNRLLQKLSPSARGLLGHLELVELKLRDYLEHSGQPIEHVYFPENCLVSIVAESAGAMIEVGMVGNEGMTALAIVDQDSQSPFDTFIQAPGSAYRTGIGALRAALAESQEMQSLFHRYGRTFTIQVAATAFANGRAKLEARLSRWLLMCGDRLGPHFRVTHEFLGIMLGVRRSGVTLALQILEGQGLIKSTRGAVALVDRQGLIIHADGCYGMPEREYQRLMGQ
jgi:CRP-like cAMP-binding protein